MLFLDLNHSVGDFNLALKFQVPNGVSALFGRSGAGKTTLVNAVAGLITPQKGRIEIAGRAVFDAGAGSKHSPASAWHRLCFSRPPIISSYERAAQFELWAPPGALF